MPVIVRWPGIVREGSTNESVVQSTDLFPPLVEIAGNSVSSFDDLDGVSLLSTLKSNQTLKRNSPVIGYRAYEDQYVSVRDGDWKLIGYRSGKINLYNVAADRRELHDLAGVHAEKVSSLVEKLKAWEIRMGVDQYSGFSDVAP